MRTRLKDVAERANLSPALVSGVLNGRANVWASEETRARVHRVARELNYHPSQAARALSAGRTRRVALVYRRLEGVEYRLAYTGIVDAFSAELQSRGYGLMVSNFATQKEVLAHLEMLGRAHACDAVILWGREEDTRPQGELLDELKMPFLVKGRHEASHPHWLQVDFDHEGMMRLATESLLQRGRRRIAYLGFPLDEPYVHALRRGFEAAHRELLHRAPTLFAACHDDVASNAAPIEAWLAADRSERPDGYVIGAGNGAWRALESSLARRGERLGVDADAAGIASHMFTLIFGEALAYQDIEIDKLAHQISPTLLDRILDAPEPADVGRVVRFLPRLTPAPTLGIPLVPGPTGP